jgi:hypothetical protein
MFYSDLFLRQTYYFFLNCFANPNICITFAATILRGGAVVARWAHNPKVGGSNPPSATRKKPDTKCQAFLFLARPMLAWRRDENEKA